MSQTVLVPPGQLINGPILIITGPALLESSASNTSRSATPIAPPPRLLSLAVLVKQAADQYRAMSDVGPRPQTSGPDPASSSQADPHEVTASQAAQVLGITSLAIGRWTACRAGASCDLVSPFGRQPGDLVWPGEPWRAARLSLFPKVTGAAPRVPRLRLVQHSHLAMFF